MTINTEPDGTYRTIKSQYFKNSLANFIRGGTFGATAVAVLDSGEDIQEPAERNGVRPDGACAMPVCGAHSGVEPRIIEYEDNNSG